MKLWLAYREGIGTVLTALEVRRLVDEFDAMVVVLNERRQP